MDSQRTVPVTIDEFDRYLTLRVGYGSLEVAVLTAKEARYLAVRLNDAADNLDSRWTAPEPNKT